MRLWGRVFAGGLLLFAAVFAGVAMAVPEARAAALGAAAVSAGFALLGVPLIVRCFRSLTGDERLLMSGVEARATIIDMTPTGWRFNRTDPVLRFRLEIPGDRGQRPAEQAVIRQSVPPQVAALLAPGSAVAVRIDPADRRRMVLDWRPLISARGGDRE
jgi:hypothetical protein